MGKLKQAVALDSAADDHAQYVVLNIDNGNLGSLTHDQNPAFPGFTGLKPNDRAKARGYVGSAGELIIGGGPPLSNYKWLLNTATFHALALQAGNTDMGMASRTSVTANSPISVLLTGYVGEMQALPGDFVATYPCGGEIDYVRNHFSEFPSPFPNLAPSALVLKGPPLTVFVRSGQQLRVSSFAVAVEGDQPLSGVLLTSQDNPAYISASQAVFVPDKMLDPNTKYTVAIRGTNDGQRFEKRFSFTTGN
jgi:hypothetical protein